MIVVLSLAHGARHIDFGDSRRIDFCHHRRVTERTFRDGDAVGADIETGDIDGDRRRQEERRVKQMRRQKHFAEDGEDDGESQGKRAGGNRRVAFAFVAVAVEDDPREERCAESAGAEPEGDVEEPEGIRSHAERRQAGDDADAGADGGEVVAEALEFAHFFSVSF